MPTASDKMTSDLLEDFRKIGLLVKKMQGEVHGANAGPLGKAVTTLATMHGQMVPDMNRMEQELKSSPPVFPEETLYRDKRKEVTKLLGATVKTAKAVSDWAKKEAAAKKKADSQDDDEAAVTVECFTDAVKDMLGNDKKLAQALAAVARGETGRSGPKQDGVGKYQHIHIGGNAKENLLFTAKGVILGIIDFHMDKRNNDSEKERIKTVATRSGGKVTLKIEGSKVTRA